jgi:hypothetical protein
MKKSLGEWVSNLIFGKMVGETEEEQRSPTWSYQRRQNKLVSSASLLSFGWWTAVVWLTSSQNIAIGITVAFAILLQRNWYFVASSSDALFDSINERINLQSAWLEVRLDIIEHREKGGRQRWTNRGGDYYYYFCPERQN